jgi:hypothetical protein
MNAFRKFFENGVELKNPSDLRRKGVEAIDNLVSSLGEGDTILGKLQRYHHESNILRGVGLEGIVRRNLQVKQG